MYEPALDSEKALQVDFRPDNDASRVASGWPKSRSFSPRTLRHLGRRFNTRIYCRTRGTCIEHFAVVERGGEYIEAKPSSSELGALAEGLKVIDPDCGTVYDKDGKVLAGDD